MKIISFLFSLFLFSWYLINQRNYEKRKQRRQVKPAEAGAENQKTEKAPAPSTNCYYIDRLTTLYNMLETAAAEEQQQIEKVNNIKRLNQFGLVVNEKNQKRALDELYRIQQRKITIENQIARL